MVKPIKLFSARNLGVAFQIINDLKDWESDPEKNNAVGNDLLGGRPTLLWTLALEGLSDAQQQDLIELVDNSDLPHDRRIQKARHLYYEAGVFENGPAPFRRQTSAASRRGGR